MPHMALSVNDETATPLECCSGTIALYMPISFVLVFIFYDADKNILLVQG
jgi:hypothetical protein